MQYDYITKYTTPFHNGYAVYSVNQLLFLYERISMTFGIRSSQSYIPTYQEQKLSPHGYALAHIILRLKRLYERQTPYL